uniref:inorganic diphosphatase n=1 Tax=Sphaeramia orbicularis TaxID=375764 RepID=A0A672YNC9_9TELE
IIFSRSQHGRLKIELALLLFIENAEGKYISPFHDIPIYANEAENIFHAVVEVPRWTNAKIEVCISRLKEPSSPKTRHTKKGNLRYVANVFPHKGYIWNYGPQPQGQRHRMLRRQRPIDICDIGNKGERTCQGAGNPALIDEGETDWKVIVINTEDPEANDLTVTEFCFVADIDDVRRLKPGYLEATFDWFRRYKVPDGKPENQFDFAIKTVKSTHEFWKKRYIYQWFETGFIFCNSMNTSVSDSPFCCSAGDAEAVVKSVSPVHIQSYYYHYRILIAIH